MVRSLKVTLIDAEVNESGDHVPQDITRDSFIFPLTGVPEEGSINE